MWPSGTKHTADVWLAWDWSLSVRLWYFFYEIFLSIPYVHKNVLIVSLIIIINEG